MPRLIRARKRLSMTSLVDVIFLLLLFFMLTSTFSKFAEVELTSAAPGSAVSADTPPLFLQLSPDATNLNGESFTLRNLPTAITNVAHGTSEAPQALLVSMKADVSAQRLTDLLVVLRSVKGITIAILASTP